MDSQSRKEPDLRKLRAPDLIRSDKSYKLYADIKRMSPEELQQRAEALEREREAFEALDPEERLRLALEAGFVSADEYARKRGISAATPNMYKMRLELLAKQGPDRGGGA